jgi:hypothetical protein
MYIIAITICTNDISPKNIIINIQTHRLRHTVLHIISVAWRHSTDLNGIAILVGPCFKKGGNAEINTQSVNPTNNFPFLFYRALQNVESRLTNGTEWC